MPPSTFSYTSAVAIDLLEGALDLNQPIDLSAFNAPFQPARTDYDWLSRDEAIAELTSWLDRVVTTASTAG